MSILELAVLPDAFFRHGSVSMILDAFSVFFVIFPLTDVFIAIGPAIGAMAVIVILALVRWTKRQRISQTRTSQKHGNRQADGGGKAFHGFSLTGFDAIL